MAFDPLIGFSALKPGLLLNTGQRDIFPYTYENLTLGPSPFALPSPEPRLPGVLAKQKGVEGFIDPTTKKFNPRAFTSEEAARYSKLLPNPPQLPPTGGIDGSPSRLPTNDADPSDRIADQIVKLETQLMPLRIQQTVAAAQAQAELNRQTLSDLLPFLDESGYRSTLRNLQASERFRRFKETMPSSVQDIMASKQNQMLQAASGEAARQQATAMQQQAATAAARGFIGQYVRSA